MLRARHEKTYFVFEAVASERSMCLKGALNFWHGNENESCELLCHVVLAELDADLLCGSRSVCQGMPTNWALGVTAPNAEGKVMRACKRFGIEHRIFWQRRSHAYRGRLINRVVPHFSRYVFLPFEQCFWAHEMKDYTHIIGLVRFGETVSVLPSGTVEKIEQICTIEDDKLILPETIKPSRFKPGQRITIVGDHNLSGCRGVYSHPIDLGRHVVDVDMMGRVVPLELDEYYLDERAFKSRRRARRKRSHGHTQSQRPQHAG
jgi:hypothetical protein